MGDSRNALQTSINRGALPPDNPGLDDEDDAAELDNRTLEKASDEGLANRRIVRVKRKEPLVVPAAAPDPFPGIQLVPTTASASNAVGTNAPLAESTMTSAEDGDEVDRKEVVDNKDAAGEETTKAEDDNQCGKSSVDPFTDAVVAQTVLCVTDVSNNAAQGTDQTEDPLEKDPGVYQAERKEAVENVYDGASSSFQQHSSSRNAFTRLASSSSFGLGDLGEKMSSGTYADLYKSTFLGEHMRRKRDVAVKVLKFDCINVDEIFQQSHLMSQLKHGNLVEFFGACTQGQTICIVTEYCLHGSIRSYLFKIAFLLKYVLKSIREAAEGMEFLHRNKIIHGNLNSSNLLIGEGGVIKVSDFWVSRVKKTNLGVATDEKDDVFNFGYVVWELVTGGTRLKKDYRYHLTSGQPAHPSIPEELDVIKEPKKVPKKLKELIESCWSDDPAERPAFAQIIDIIKKIELEPEMEKRREEMMRLEKDRLGEEDRQMKIKKITERVSRGGPRFLCGDTLIVHPKLEHRATVVWLHDSFSVGSGGVCSREFVESLLFPHIKWICPTAPTRDVSEHWFVEDDQHPGLDDSEAFVAELFKEEPENVLKGIGGIGKGSGLALYFATRCVLGIHETKLATAIGIRGMPPPQRNLLASINTADGAVARAALLPVLLAEDENRSYDFEKARKYDDDLRSAGFRTVELQTLTWSPDSRDSNTQNLVRNWLEKTLQLESVYDSRF